MFQGLKVNAAFTQQLGNLSLLLGCIPVKDEIVKAGVCVIDVLAGVVGNTLRAEQFAIGIVNRYHLADDFNPTAITVNNGFLLG